ncbi:MAG TPA: acyl carrier protein [Planctomycetota bacterium]|nr:acyl carrier protein [Planctomycetota bacterium]
MPETRAQILAAVRTFVADSFRDGRADGLTDDLGLVTSGIVDSAGVVHLVQFLERRFSVAIADEEVGLQHFNTLAAIADLIAAKLAATTSTGCAGC